MTHALYSSVFIAFNGTNFYISLVDSICVGSFLSNMVKELNDFEGWSDAYNQTYNVYIFCTFSSVKMVRGRLKMILLMLG